jgi:phosphatidylserine/phosphatidylglycerophosphate/cardiolipin synthase-like enzyme
MTGQSQDRFFDLEENQPLKCPLFHEEEGLVRDSRLKYIVGGPEHRGQNPITNEIAHLIEDSSQEVNIANLLFNPDKKISMALTKAKAKQVALNGYFNGTGVGSSAGHYLYAWPNRYNYHLLSNVYECEKENILYHKKVMTVDKRYAVVGSYNFGVKSAKWDYENVCVFDDPRIAALMEQALEEDKHFSAHFSGDNLTSKWRWSQIPGRLAIAALGSLFG